MAKVRKVPYYVIERSLLRSPRWRLYKGSAGAVPINTFQTISFDRLPPGSDAKADRLLPNVTPGGVQKEKTREEKNDPARPGRPKSATPQKRISLFRQRYIDAEDREKLAIFDLQDIPAAMEKMGWPVAAKAARRWFSGQAHVYNDQPDSEQPLDDSIVSLRWVLGYKTVNNKLDELLRTDIYSEKALALVKRKLLEPVRDAFQRSQSAKPNLNFETEIINSDLRQFHIDWHFQRKKISTFDTSDWDWMTPTDLTATLGNFLLYAAIGRVEVYGQRYFDYSQNPYRYCMDAEARMTHVYVYLKDNYSFNDKDPANSQYLGHWNKQGMTSSLVMAANELLGQYYPSAKMRLKGGKKEEFRVDWDYLPFPQKPLDKPIDTRRSFLRKFVEMDVYWPVFNRSYNDWRASNDQGEDFMIYSKPELYELETPITMKLGTLFRPCKAGSPIC